MRRLQNIDSSAAALWASAFVIAALIIVQAGRLPGNQAHAEMATGNGAYTLVTADAGTGGDQRCTSSTAGTRFSWSMRLRTPGSSG
jgi:hypothetical protein